MRLGSRQVEELMLARHGIERRVAFRGRLEHLRRLGCPVGVNTGKGRPATFDWPQLIELAFALDLMELGLSPEFSSSVLKANREKLFVGTTHLFSDETSVNELCVASDNGKWPLKFSTFVRINVHALSGLMPDGEQQIPTLQLIHGHKLEAWFRDAPEHKAANVIIDLGSKVVGLLTLISLHNLTPREEVADDLLNWTAKFRSELWNALAANEKNHDVHS